MRIADLFLSAGMATSPRFMEEAGERLGVFFREHGWDVRTALLFPYGDRSRSWVKQVREIRHDMLLRPHRQTRSIGGQRISNYMRAVWRGGMLLVVGHSGGGIAGLHALQSWEEEEQGGLLDQARVVLIGTPKSPVPLHWQPRTMHIRSCRRNGVTSDPVVHLGTWGGWIRGDCSRIPRWDPLLYAPGRRERIPMIGTHPDYFRSRPPFVDGEGRSNLDKVTGCIIQWLNLS